MIPRLVLVLCALLCGASAASAGSERSIRYHYANDLFAGSDYYFTQGMGLDWRDPRLAQAPLVLPLPALGDAGPTQVTWLWRYEGFTPIDYDEPAVQLGDRPFASTMTFGLRSERATGEGDTLSAGWSLGFFGPAAGGAEFQAEVHRWTGDPCPLGWRNQLENDVVLQLEAGYAYCLLRLGSFVELHLQAGARLGMLYTDASAGGRVRAGLLPDGDEPGVYLWAAGRARAVGFNATLQGGLLRDSDYTLSDDDVRRFVPGAQVGLVVELESVGFELTWTRIGPEFGGGRNHGTGQWAVTVRY